MQIWIFDREKNHLFCWLSKWIKPVKYEYGLSVNWYKKFYRCLVSFTVGLFSHLMDFMIRHLKIWKFVCGQNKRERQWSNQFTSTMFYVHCLCVYVVSIGEKTNQQTLFLRNFAHIRVIPNPDCLLSPLCLYCTVLSTPMCLVELFALVYIIII